jgi:hypothetical protein
MTAPYATQWLSNPVSKARLPKMGIFALGAGDFRRIGLAFREKQVLGDLPPNCKSPPLAGLSATLRTSFPDRETAWLGRAREWRAISDGQWIRSTSNGSIF